MNGENIEAKLIIIINIIKRKVLDCLIMQQKERFGHISFQYVLSRGVRAND